MKEALYYEKLKDKKIRCQLCPHNCLISEGKYGICNVRKNEGGLLYTENYGKITAAAVDPIEKKPLYHFYPAAPILSFGTFGCNFRCPYCQNWEISQMKPQTRAITPESILEMCMDRGIDYVAFTYNEPMIWYEFVLDSAKILTAHNKKVVLVTNGYINQEPLKELVKYISAANIDFKAITDSFYRKICGGQLESVLNSIKLMYKAGVHIELTTLIIPEYNDSEDEMRKEAQWIRDNLSDEVPLHLSRYFPHYKMKQYATPVNTLEKLYKIAKNYLKYVYLGNVWGGEYSDTICPQCGNLLIQRSVYYTKVVGLEGNKCSKCGYQANVII